MKVKELVKLLEQCDQETPVELTHLRWKESDESKEEIICPIVVTYPK